MKKLKVLDLSGCNITDAGIKYLTESNNLESLMKLKL